MNLFVKSKTIDFGEKQVVVEEIGVPYLLLSDEDKQDPKKLLELHTNLTKKEIDKLTIEAFNKLLDEFYSLNSEHYKDKEEINEDEEGK